jgi:hypothetical protein
MRAALMKKVTGASVRTRSDVKDEVRVHLYFLIDGKNVFDQTPTVFKGKDAMRRAHEYVFRERGKVRRCDNPAYPEPTEYEVDLI